MRIINRKRMKWLWLAAAISLCACGKQDNEETRESRTVESHTEPFVVPTTEEETTGYVIGTEEPGTGEEETDSTQITIPPVETTTVEQETPSATDPVTLPEVTTAPITDKHFVIVLDPGHGGSPGAQYNGVRECDLTLKASNYCKEYLLSHYEGVTVYLTRETDKSLGNNDKADLENRVIFAAEHNADFLVSLHFNSSGSGSVQGALTLISKQPWVREVSRGMALSILNQISHLGIKICTDGEAGVVLRDSDYYFDENGKPLDYYAICRHSASRNIPAVIVEHCFIDNVNDVKFVDTEDEIRALGYADAIGIAEYLGLPPKQ